MRPFLMLALPLLAACADKPGFGKYYVAIDTSTHDCTFEGNDRDETAYSVATTLTAGQAEVDNRESGEMVWGEVDSVDQLLTCTTTPGELSCERTYTEDYSSGVAWGDATHTSEITITGEWVRWSDITDELLQQRVETCDSGARDQCGAFIGDLSLSATCEGPECDRINQRMPNMDFPCTSTATVQGIQVPLDFFPG